MVPRYSQILLLLAHRSELVPSLKKGTRKAGVEPQTITNLVKIDLFPIFAPMLLAKAHLFFLGRSSRLPVHAGNSPLGDTPVNVTVWLGAFAGTRLPAANLPRRFLSPTVLSSPRFVGHQLVHHCLIRYTSARTVVGKMGRGFSSAFALSPNSSWRGDVISAAYTLTTVGI